jgi:hypothetical protein
MVSEEEKEEEEEEGEVGECVIHWWLRLGKICVMGWMVVDLGWDGRLGNLRMGGRRVSTTPR